MQAKHGGAASVAGQPQAKTAAEPRALSDERFGKYLQDVVGFPPAKAMQNIGFLSFSRAVVPGTVSGRAEALRIFGDAIAGTHEPVAVRAAVDAVLFLYREVLHKAVDGLQETIHAKRKRRIPVVLTRDEVRNVLTALRPKHSLMAGLMYGAGVRLRECLSLRVKDVDFDRGQISIRAGKGGKDRPAVLPDSLRRKPGSTTADRTYRFHLHLSAFQRQMSLAVRDAGITKKATAHSLRHSFAAHLIEDGCDIRAVRELLGHSNVQTVMIYTHIATRNQVGVMSPADRLDPEA